MTPKRPPAVAAWLFKHFGCGPHTDAVLGDLDEQYLRKNGIWYWRQVLTGIPVSIITEARGHKLLVARANVAGCVTWLVCLDLYPPVVHGLAAGPVVSFDIFNALLHAPLGTGLWAATWSPVPHSLLYPADSAAAQLWTQMALPLLAWTVCGWIVTRVDVGRAHRDLAPLFAGFVLLLNLIFVVPGVTGFLAEVHRHPFGPSGAPFAIDAVDLIVPTAANVAISIVGILLGGSLRGTQLI